MSCNIDKVIEVARSQINYLEKETWSQQDDFTANAGDENYVKYSRDLAKLNYFNSSKKGVAWCSIFVAWDFVQAYGVNAARAQLCHPVKDNCAAGCNSARNYFKRKGRLFTSPLPGDVIFFWNSAKKEASHTGLVEKVTDSHVYTIEGNTSSASGVIDNGGAVAAKKYRLDYDRIAGYGRPDYENISPDGETPSTEEEFKMTVGQAWVIVPSGSSVNFRQKPSTAAPKVSGMGVIKAGEEVTITSGDQTWAAVTYKGHSGYVMLKFLTQDKPADSKPARSVDDIVNEIKTLLAELAARAV